MALPEEALEREGASPVSPSKAERTEGDASPTSPASPSLAPAQSPFQERKSQRETKIKAKGPVKPVKECVPPRAHLKLPEHVRQRWLQRLKASGRSQQLPARWYGAQLLDLCAAGAQPAALQLSRLQEHQQTWPGMWQDGLRLSALLVQVSEMLFQACQVAEHASAALLKGLEGDAPSAPFAPSPPPATPPPARRRSDALAPSPPPASRRSSAELEESNAALGVAAPTAVLRAARRRCFRANLAEPAPPACLPCRTFQEATTMAQAALAQLQGSGGALAAALRMQPVALQELQPAFGEQTLWEDLGCLVPFLDLTLSKLRALAALVQRMERDVQLLPQEPQRSESYVDHSHSMFSLPMESPSDVALGPEQALDEEGPRSFASDEDRDRRDSAGSEDAMQHAEAVVAKTSRKDKKKKTAKGKAKK
ncbi:unnamed protein product [Effrenium voratum]|nr:unnamed protein product [Effrenium voratum]